ncbi:DUF1501 domain-containing protein [Aeoliella mucimassa]|uniref:DUF1501 domain-containing protein n=1 Tax=Aeoliella mucimassa TaxID=2527972 RepID=A0A518AVU7_9BACT|nr:DUF1501 domain-containing protein [Aeoliella mucimassa]QDU58844.1 hypothetical protein Pan181_50840 [Aeoliella mucimassa]
MSYQLQHHIRVRANKHGLTARRDFLKAVGAAATAAGALSFTDALSLAASDLRKQNKACILLWMAGGPSQFETFSPKPDHENGGATKAISTAVSGIQIAENLPRVADVMDEIAIVRSMTSKEGSHPRASFYMHHGYLPMGGVKFPTLGSNVVHQIGDAASELPSFVRIGGRSQGTGNGGFLGVDYDPLTLQNATKPPQNSTPATSRSRYERRLTLLQGLDNRFAEVEGTDLVNDHRKLVDAASEMILSPQMEAFDIERETNQMRDAYGRTDFGASCLMARRLVERGVTFVEVNVGGWDTHDNNFERVATLTNQVDQPMAQLIADLRQRGMLDNTLVVWMGEFGRTPKINGRNGRDHYPRAFNVALAGGGVRGGQVIGSTNAAGTEVVDRPVQVKELFASIYSLLGIDYTHENMSLIGRPIRLVDEGEPVTELWS